MRPTKTESAWIVPAESTDGARPRAATGEPAAVRLSNGRLGSSTPSSVHSGRVNGSAVVFRWISCHGARTN
jgi:hypothetical protein